MGGTVWPLGVERFCGVNSEQHFYLETVESSEGRFVEFRVETERASDYKDRRNVMLCLTTLRRTSCEIVTAAAVGTVDQSDLLRRHPHHSGGTGGTRRTQH